MTFEWVVIKMRNRILSHPKCALWVNYTLFWILVGGGTCPIQLWSQTWPHNHDFFTLYVSLLLGKNFLKLTCFSNNYNLMIKAPFERRDVPCIAITGIISNAFGMAWRSAKAFLQTVFGMWSFFDLFRRGTFFCWFYA